MSFLDSILTGVGFVVKGIGEGLQELGTTVRSWGERIISNMVRQGVSVNQISSKHQIQNIQGKLQTIDAEFIELERKELRDGGLSKRDQEFFEELHQLKAANFEELQQAKAVEIAVEQQNNLDDYDSDFLDNEKVHILQYQMGQIALNKRCPRCNRPMFLQHKNRLNGSLYQLDDFFWSCMGFYSNNPLTQCRGSRQFELGDVGLLYKSEIELTISNSDLNTIFHQPESLTHVKKRMQHHIKDKDDEILCKEHYIPMVLSERKNPVGGLLDLYYLKCPHPHCQQTVKLKSPAQLTAFLKRKEGRGLL